MAKQPGINCVNYDKSLFMSVIDRSRIVAKREDIFFKPLSSCSGDGDGVLNWIKSQHDRKLLKKGEYMIEPDQETDSDLDVFYLQSLDPVEWKDQDHYQVIGLMHLRERATDEDIKRAYQQRVLKHHPDKRQAAGEVLVREGDYFACIVKAYEILSDPLKRQAFDSVDPMLAVFYDYVPPKTVKSLQEFFTVYGEWFALNARWSTVEPVPLLGSMSSTRGQVDDFYQFWSNFDSWREYSYLDEEDKKSGQGRWMKRWFEKRNKAERAILKKEEMSRIRGVVEAAWSLDPRISLIKEMEKRKKLEKKLEKQKIVQEQKQQLEKVRLEEEAKEKEEAERRKRETEEREAIAKKERDAQRKELKKQRKLLRDISKQNNYFCNKDNGDGVLLVTNMAAVEEMCEFFQADKLSEVNKALSSNKGENVNKEQFEKFVKLLNDLKSKSAQVQTQKTANSKNPGDGAAAGDGVRRCGKNEPENQWSQEESQLLIKSVNLFPAGTAQRWEVVANYINQHSPKHEIKRSAKEVLAKAKDFNSSDFSKNSMKEEANQKAYEIFEKDVKNKNQSQNIPLAPATKTSEETETNSKRSLETEIGSAKAKAFAVEDEAKAWNATEQKLFEQALKTYGASVADRWDRIAECVPGRAKKECVARYKELAALVKAKKSAQKI